MLSNKNDIIKLEDITDNKLIDIKLNIEKEIQQFIDNKSINDNIISIYEKSNKISIYELSDNESYEYIINLINFVYKTDDNPLIRRIRKKYGNIDSEMINKMIKTLEDIFNYIFNKLDIKIKDRDNIEDIIRDNFDKICKLFIFTPLELRENYGYIDNDDRNNKRRSAKVICQELINDNKLYLEMIHPKYCYKMLNGMNELDIIDRYNEEEYQIEPHQKQGIFGLFRDTKSYRICHDYFWNNLRELTYDRNNNEIYKMIDIYSFEYNKLAFYCISKRDNLFCFRYVNSGRLPIHKFHSVIDNEDRFYNKIENIINYDLDKDKNINEIIQKNLLYIGLVEHNKTNMIYFMFYEYDKDRIYIYDHLLNSLHNGLLTGTPSITFMELQQSCLYLNLYSYKYKKNDHYIFFSKYDIFNLNEKYEEEVYKPLTLEEFNKTLEYYRDNLEIVKCYKYPSLNIDLPSCIKKDDIINKFKDYNNKLYSSQIFIVKHNTDHINCEITDHTSIENEKNKINLTKHMINI